MCVWRRAGDVSVRERGGTAFGSPSSDFGGHLGARWRARRPLHLSGPMLHLPHVVCLFVSIVCLPGDVICTDTT